MQCPISDLKTVEAVLDVGKECAARTEEEWIVGGGWWVSLFDHRGPRKELLDQAVPGRAVVLYNVDAHTAWVSSRALELAGITASTPDPEDGVIERDPRTGDPSGTLREAAIDLVMAKAPAPSAEMRLEGSARVAAREDSSALRRSSRRRSVTPTSRPSRRSRRVASSVPRCGWHWSIQIPVLRTSKSCWRDGMKSPDRG